MEERKKLLKALKDARKVASEAFAGGKVGILDATIARQKAQRALDIFDGKECDYDQ